MLRTTNCQKSDPWSASRPASAGWFTWNDKSPTCQIRREIDRTFITMTLLLSVDIRLDLTNSYCNRSFRTPACRLANLFRRCAMTLFTEVCIKAEVNYCNHHNSSNELNQTEQATTNIYGIMKVVLWILIIFVIEGVVFGSANGRAGSQPLTRSWFKWKFADGRCLLCVQKAKHSVTSSIKYFIILYKMYN